MDLKPVLPYCDTNTQTRGNGHGPWDSGTVGYLRRNRKEGENKNIPDFSLFYASPNMSEIPYVLLFLNPAVTME